MQKVILIVGDGNVVNVRKFDTITEAYHCYLREFSTFGDWWYYLRCAHKFLHKVEDEQIMECVFRNVFKENVHLLIEGVY